MLRYARGGINAAVKKMSISVAHIGFLAPSAVNGIEVSKWWLARAQVQQGARVFVYRIGGTSETISGVEIRSFRRLPDLLQCLRENPDDLDLVHLHSVFTPANARIGALCRKLGLPYVITPNGGYDSHVLHRHWLKKALYLRLSELSLLRGAAGIIAVAAKEESDILRLGATDRIFVGANTFDVESCLEVQRRLGAHVVWLGRWDIYHKGIDRLIDVWSKVELLAPDFELHLYGDGDGRDAVEKLVRAAGSRRIVVHDPVHGAEKWAVLSEAALYVHCSRWEVFGLAITEAMASGVPVAVSHGCYLAEDIAASGGGVILPDDDRAAAECMAALLSDQHGRLMMQDKGRDFAVARFSPAVVASSTLDIYSQAIAGS